MKDYEQLYYDLKYENKKLQEDIELLKSIIKEFKSISKENEILLTIIELNKKRRTNG